MQMYLSASWSSSFKKITPFYEWVLLGIIEDSQVLEGFSYHISVKVLKRSWVMRSRSLSGSLREAGIRREWSCESSFSCPGTSWQESLLCGWVNEAHFWGARTEQGERNRAGGCRSVRRGGGRGQGRWRWKCKERTNPRAGPWRWHWNWVQGRKRGRAGTSQVRLEGTHRHGSSCCFPFSPRVVSSWLMLDKCELSERS